MRMIDADATLDTLEGLTEQVTGEGAALVKALVFAALKSKSVIPTVGDERFRIKKRCHWIEHPEEELYYIYECSGCHEKHAWTYAFCPDCGAKMEAKDA